MKTVGKYEVFEQLGTGSMGVIYRAHDTILDRDVALKTIAGTGPVDAELKERFYREAKACARLQHPNVVMIYELGEEDNLLFIALELLTGSDLRRFIAERRPLPDAKKLEVIAGLCDGLQKAHDAGIIHRDLKPSNIFLTNDGVGKLLDFGVARLPSSKLTVVGRVIGTPNYMAPEQILGKPCDARTDIFALGIVAYEFLTFAHPFAGASVPKRIMNDAPDSLIARNPALPADVEPVIGKALAKDPDERYKSADEFARALRAVLAKCFSAESLSTVSAESLSIQSPSSVVSMPAPPPVSPELPKDMNTEYKMSEILGALQRFDAALDRENVAEARSALQTVDRLAKIDDRFAAAATESHGRLSELEARVPAPPPVAVTPPPVTAARPPVATAPPSIAAPPTRPVDLPVASVTVSRPTTQSRPTVLTAPVPPAKSAFLDSPPIADVPPPAGNVFTSSEPGDVTSLFIPRPSVVPQSSPRPTERPFNPAPQSNFSTAESISSEGSRVGSASESRVAAESPQRRVPSTGEFTPPPTSRAKAPVQTDAAPSLDPPHQKWWAKISRWDIVIMVISTAAVVLMMVFVHFLFLNQSDVTSSPISCFGPGGDGPGEHLRVALR